MNLDILVDQAQNNGGKASMAVGPESSALSKNNFLTSPQTSPPLLPAPNYTLFDQHHPMESCFQGTAPTDPIRELERANKFYKEAKEYKKNSEENERKNRMSQKQFLLRSTQINSIDNIILERNIPSSVPPSIITIASCLSDRTGLNPLGCLYDILGSISIATWGRITIKLSNAWSEPAVDMILQVSTAGTKKSSLTKHLREPFEHFCSQSNIMYDEQSRNAKEKKRLTQKTSDRRSKKIIEAALKEGATMQQEDEIAFLKLAIDEVAQFNCNLAQSIEITPRVQLLVDKGTTFQLAATLSEQGECQGCITAEGNMINSKMICSPEAANLFLRGHTQEPYVYENAKKQIKLTHPALPMINLVQPVVACKLYGNEFLNENGVTARFVPFFHHCTNFSRHELNMDDGLTAYKSKVTSLLQLFHTQDKNAQRYEVCVTDEALELIKNFEKHIRFSEIQNTPEAAMPCMRKAHGQAVRFAWDIHAWNNEQPHLSPISGKEMQVGIDLARASFSHIKYAYSPTGLVAYSVARKILESLVHINDSWEQNKLISDGIDSTTLQQRIGRKSKDVNNALRLLEKHNYLAIYDDATNNLKVVLHPYFYSFCISLEVR